MVFFFLIDVNEIFCGLFWLSLEGFVYQIGNFLSQGRRAGYCVKEGCVVSGGGAGVRYGAGSRLPLGNAA
jgi:hypothetical protein